MSKKISLRKNSAGKTDGEKVSFSTGMKNTAYLLDYVRRHVPALFYTNILTGILWGYLNVASSVLVIQVVFNMIGEGRSFADVCRFLLMMSMICFRFLGLSIFVRKGCGPS